MTKTSLPHSSADEAKRQAIRVLAGGPVLYPEEYALIAREYLNLFEQLEARQQVIEHVWAWMQTTAAEEGSYFFALADEVQKFVVSNPASEPKP